MGLQSCCRPATPAFCWQVPTGPLVVNTGPAATCPGVEHPLHHLAAVCFWQLTSLLSLRSPTCKMHDREGSVRQCVWRASHRGSLGCWPWWRLFGYQWLFFYTGRFHLGQPMPYQELFPLKRLGWGKVVSSLWP